MTKPTFSPYALTARTQFSVDKDGSRSRVQVIQRHDKAQRGGQRSFPTYTYLSLDSKNFHIGYNRASTSGYNYLKQTGMSPAKDKDGYGEEELERAYDSEQCKGKSDGGFRHK